LGNQKASLLKGDFMGADQIAAIRPAILELEVAMTESPRTEYFAHFEVAGRPSLWAEVTIGTVNMAYPFTEEPLERLATAGVQALPGLALQSWKPMVFATFSYEHDVARSVAKFVDSVFLRLHGLETDYPLDVAISRLHP
jgi:hypothetical protein